MNIVDYAETKMERFESTQFNLVDSLILSQFAYVYFNDIVPGFADHSEPVRIAELLKAENIQQMLHNVRDPKNNHRLLIALGMSPRFRDIRMCCYSDSLNIAEQKQFAAVIYLINDKNAYVAYRGTDLTFIGWKEDFNMAFIYA
ncbi:MAG: Mbeg1-like protein [Sedimentibacter sp.]